ncbi:hypothetical protein GFL88_12055 [Rhizobium leguminosarum bv. viciae]|nr:hypothetical protein [Rhizobium leguminosarum bv. viciae]
MMSSRCRRDRSSHGHCWKDRLRRPPHPPYGHLLPLGRRGNRDVAAYLFSPRGEGAGRRMRGPHGTPFSY